MTLFPPFLSEWKTRYVLKAPPAWAMGHCLASTKARSNYSDTVKFFNLILELKLSEQKGFCGIYESSLVISLSCHMESEEESFKMAREMKGRDF